MRGIAFAGAGLFAVMVLPCRAGAGAVIFRGDFESGSRSGFQEDIEGDGEYEIVSSPEPVRAGKYSCKYTLRKARRVELVPRGCTAPVGSERWYGFSIFIPEDWVANRRKDEVVAQWHASPDRDKGENWRSPPLAVRTKGNGWQVTCIWDSKPLSNSGVEGSTTIWRGNIEKGRWTDWVFHVRWSYRDDGLVEVWKNGQLLKRREGPNCYNDKGGLYFKWGIYHTLENRVLYNDEFRMGDEKAGYRAVAPPGSRLPPALAARLARTRPAEPSGPTVWDIAARMARAKPAAAAGPLSGFAGPVSDARRRAMEGDGEAAAGDMEALAREAKAEAAKGALARIARGLRATARLKKWIVEGVAAGRHEATFVNLLGKPTRGRVIGADQSGLTVRAAGADFPVTWGALGAKKLAALAVKYAAEGDADAAAAIEDFRAAFGLDAEGR